MLRALSTKQRNQIQNLEAFIESYYQDDKTAHDLGHIKRVVDTATRLITNEDIFETAVIAYLHEIFDVKLSPIEQSFESFLAFLKKQEIDLLGREAKIFVDICSIGFKGGFNTQEKSPEAILVSDADYLDAMGVIGIARAFYYAGAKGLPFHDYHLQPSRIKDEQSYRTEISNVIDHFNVKLFKLKDLIISEKAKKIAEQRHQELVSFYQQFLSDIKLNNKGEDQ
ncbi:MAG TPA: phosphohydrolase [Erysipelothrix sp.]